MPIRHKESSRRSSISPPKIPKGVGDPNNRLSAPDGSKRGKGRQKSEPPSPKEKEGLSRILLTEVPPYPKNEFLRTSGQNKNYAKRWWSRYWQLLIDSNQAIEDFIPSITTLCSLRQDLGELEEGLQRYPIYTKLGINISRAKLQTSKTILAMEGTFGFSLATNDIRKVDPSKNKNRMTEAEEDVLPSTNSLASRKAQKNPFELTDEDNALFMDEQETT